MFVKQFVLLERLSKQFLCLCTWGAAHIASVNIKNLELTNTLYNQCLSLCNIQYKKKGIVRFSSTVKSSRNAPGTITMVKELHFVQ